MPRNIFSSLQSGHQSGQAKDHPQTIPHGLTPKSRHAKAPRTRPPRGLRDFAPLKRLPPYTGPYPVGTMEIELPARQPRPFGANITRHGRHPLQLRTVLMTIYYPAVSPPAPSRKSNPSDAASNAPGDATSTQPGRKGWKGTRPSRQLWLGRPRQGMMHGYSLFASMGRLGMPLFAPVAFTKLPAWRNADLSTRVPRRGARVETGKRRTPAWLREDRLVDAPLTSAEGSKEGETRERVRYPLIMFSHGLGGTRTMYSSICGELASYGYVVCAVEHRDGSGPRTYVNRPPEEEGSEESLAGEKLGHSFERGPLKMKNGYDVVDYIFPQGNEYDTSPDNEKGVDRELRDAQIELRMAEVEEAYAAMEILCAGNGEDIARRNLRRGGFKGASSHGLEGIDWGLWKYRIHLTSVTALGHSFGAATCIEMLRHRDRFTWLSQGIILDIWSAGTRPTESDADKHRLRTPLLAINTEAFTYWPSNFDFVTKLTSEKNPCPTWLATIRGTIHMSASDFAVLFPHMCSFFLKSTANPVRAMDLHVDMCLGFLHTMLPDDFTDKFAHAYPRDRYLTDTPIMGLEEIPSRLKKMPDEKYMASHLKIRHEWKWRMAPTYTIGRKWIERTEEGDGEVWVHSRPSEGSVEDWRREQYDAAHDVQADGLSGSTTNEEKVREDSARQVDEEERTESGKEASPHASHHVIVPEDSAI